MQSLLLHLFWKWKPELDLHEIKIPPIELSD